MNRAVHENPWVRRARYLTQLLILSGTLNIGLSATFVYFVLREKQEPVTLEMKPAEKLEVVLDESNDKILNSYASLSFQDLLLRLENKELVEEGYKKRDLALACLVAFHHFNLDRALGGLPLQQRQILFRDASGEEAIQLTSFPGLADYQYQAILNYAKMEKWPLTSQGLFFAMKRKEERRDGSLIEAFSLTPEFHSVSILFSRTGIPLSKELLTALLIEGEWELLHQFTEEQRSAQELSIERRRAFLLNYFQGGSKIAAQVLFQIDFEFVQKRFSDDQILQLLQLLDNKTPSLALFAKELLLSPRSDAVQKGAAIKLYALANIPPPDPYDHSLAVERFAPESLIKKVEAKPQSVPVPVAQKRFHIVQQGDSLWKIARKYQTTVLALKQHNKLDTDRLRPGKKLEIP